MNDYASESVATWQAFIPASCTHVVVTSIFREEKQMLGELDQRQIEELLHTAHIGRIGCYADQRTYIVPIYYAYDGTSIYAYSLEGMKIYMMRANSELVELAQHRCLGQL